MGEPIVIGAIVTAVLSIITAVGTLYKVRPDANRITVGAAEGAVIVQTGVIKSLQEELARMDNDHKECEIRLTNMRAEHIKQMAALRKDYQNEIRELRILVEAIDERKKDRRCTHPDHKESP